MIKTARLVLLAILILTVGIHPVAGAIEISSKFEMIVFSDSNASGCAPASASASTIPSGGTKGNEKNIEIVLRYFTGKGLTLAQASGFIGNMTQESGVNPNAEYPGKTVPDGTIPNFYRAFGLIQWLDSRQTGLINLAQTSNRKTTDIDLQLDYIWQELNTSYKSTLQALEAHRAEMTPEMATIILHGKSGSEPEFNVAPALGYEASGDSLASIKSKRVPYAVAAYNKYKGVIADGAGIQGVGTTSTLTATGGCAAIVSGECSATKPVMGQGGNGQQMSVSQLVSAYGPGGSGAKPNIVDSTFMGLPVKMNKKVVGCLKAVEDEIKAKNINYKVDQVASWRESDGQVGMSSYHMYGAAIDINWGNDIYTGRNPYVPDGSARPYDIPQAYIDAFRNHGWSWGGAWSSPKDYMHFEFNGINPGR